MLDRYTKMINTDPQLWSVLNVVPSSLIWFGLVKFLKMATPIINQFSKWRRIINRSSLVFLLNEGGAEETQRLHCKSHHQKLTESALLSGNSKFSKCWLYIRKGSGTNQIGWRFSPYTLPVLVNICAFVYICSSKIFWVNVSLPAKIVFKKHINPLFFGSK